MSSLPLIVSLILLAGLCVILDAIWRQRAEKLQSENRALRQDLAKLREQQVEESLQMRARQLAIFNSMVEGILILDGRGRVQTTNKSLERLFSLSSEVLGMTLMEAFRTHELLEIVDRVQKEGLVRGFELPIPGLGSTRYLEVNAAAIRDRNEEACGMILIFHDFTRIKELENIRTEFVANVSHELRTPLTLIKGYVETLIDGAKDDPAVATKFLQKIHKHTNRLTFLIEDLLTLSHLESGRVVIHRQVSPIHPIVERVIEELQPAARQKNICLSNEVDPQLLANTDADRMQQVLYNLIDNAIKYGRPGGNVRVSAISTEEAVQVVVEDDGPGIPEDAQERIFERFFRVDRARSREAGGTGLGLAIVKHIVQSHGGKVWVESELENGSTFYFTLPHSTNSGT
ncbi:MAG TPA: ATP-binding protein [Verrucomicrobiae bacterium]|nr:ATP-binding protein [Verrucomicrobiae bacterium]